MKGRSGTFVLGCVAPALILWVLTVPVRAEIYQYRNERGQWHFTDRLTDVPESETPWVVMESPEKPPPSAKDAKKEAIGDTEQREEQNDPSEKPPDEGVPGKPEKIPIMEELNKEKEALEGMHAGLMKRKKALQRERETLKTPEQVREYRKKVTRLNKEIETYKKRNRAFQKKVDMYNKAVREEGEK